MNRQPGPPAGGGTMARQDGCDVVLVSMPFVSILLPSIGLGLLNAGMQQRSIRSRVLYFNLDFAALEPALYERIIVETSQRDLVGEWIFSRALFSRHATARDTSYRELLLSPDPDRGIHAEGMPSELVAALDTLRREVEPFLDRCAQTVLELAPRIVGFTSLFQQHVASLALARRLKERRPDLSIVFGGANCEGPMGRELVRQFPFVDAAVSGEADLTFPTIVERVCADQPIGPLRNVFLAREEAGGIDADQPMPTTVSLDTLPDPDYDDFFATHERLQLPCSEALRIPFETSRGCWWGEKNHCTFCGLNGNTMAHRSKSAQRALAELERLISRYPGCKVEVVDNILDMSYFRDFIPALAAARLPTELFYEVKANLKKHQVYQLAAAGITTIQPGIESLSDAVLSIMKKGVSGLQNVQLLKWCAGAGVRASWNVLTGFPGEPPEDYRRMAEQLPLLFHLHPPAGCSAIRIDRFSPNFDRAAELGFAGLRPFPAYGLVLPLSAEAVHNLAYYFTFDYADGRQPHRYVAPVREQVARWRAQHAASQLTAVLNDQRLLILDTRAVAPEPVVILDGFERDVYLAADQVCTPASLARALPAAHGNRAQQISRQLDDFVDRKLMIEDQGRYLALAVMPEDSWPTAPVLGTPAHEPAANTTADRL